MKRLILFIISILLISGCSLKEEYVPEDKVYGLYKRSYYEQEEFICVKADHTYEYFVRDGTINRVLSKGSWNYTLLNGKSVFGLDNFNYSMALGRAITSGGSGMPVKYSHAKEAVVLRMDADFHSLDFIRIDSTSCEINSSKPE